MSRIKTADYRADIDGLRAIAIFSVVVFHAFPNYLPGGFVGVDIFFVISGFLISQIIVREMLSGSFTFRDFYVRRINRIFPALALTLTTVLVCGWWILYPSEFQQLGRHVFAGAAFIANFQQWSEAGYFDRAAELKPLLHLWSLGIEEQFYLFFPVLLVFGLRCKRYLILMIGAILCLSLLIGIRLSMTNGTAAFYSPASRIWELMAGCLLAIVPMLHPSLSDRCLTFPSLRKWISVCGFALLLISLVVINKSKQFLGVWAIVPVFGTILMIGAGSVAVCNRWISNPVFVRLGLISYPLYLWHWPIFAYLNILEHEPSSSFKRLIAILVALILADLTYRLLERPIRQKSPRRLAAYCFIVVIAVGVTGLFIGMHPFATRLGAKTELQPIFKALAANDLPQRGSIYDGKTDGMAVFIGDSFLEHYFVRIRRMTQTSADALSVTFMGVGGCPPLPKVSRIADPGGCVKILREAFERASREDVTSVVIGSAWHYFYPITARNLADDPAVFERNAMVYYEDDPKRVGISPGTPDFEMAFYDLQASLASLIATGKRVYIVLPTPISDELDPLRTVNRLSGQIDWGAGIAEAKYLASFAPIIKELKKISVATGAILLNPAKELCTDAFCPAFNGGGAVYKDVGHLSTSFVIDHIAVFDDSIRANVPND